MQISTECEIVSYITAKWSYIALEHDTEMKTTLEMKTDIEMKTTIEHDTEMMIITGV